MYIKKLCITLMVGKMYLMVPNGYLYTKRLYHLVWSSLFWFKSIDSLHNKNAKKRNYLIINPIIIPLSLFS